MSIPLIQKPEKDDINTSIIAIKRNIERINMLLGLSNSEEIDTSEFVKKSDIVDVVEAGNMNPVTSNAVAEVTDTLRTAINGKADGNLTVKYLYLTPRQLNTASTLTSIVAGLGGPCFCLFSVGWEEYTSFPYAGTHGYILVTPGSSAGFGKLRNYGDKNYTRAFWWIDSISANRFSGIQTI